MSTQSGLNDGMKAVYEYTGELSDLPVSEDSHVVEANWYLSRKLFDNELHRYVSTARVINTAPDALENLSTIELSVSHNENNNTLCLWECGGMTNDSGYSLIIGRTDGSKSLPVSVFRDRRAPNRAHAVIQIYPGCVVALATQVRGNGVVLLYRVESFKKGVTINSYYNRQEKSYVSEPVNRQYAVLSLCKMIELPSNNVILLNNNLKNITLDHPIVQTALKKSTLYNCVQAMYIRTFFFVKNGYKHWDINSVDTSQTPYVSNKNEVSSILFKILDTFSETVCEDKFNNAVLGTAPFVPTKPVETITDGVWMKFVTFVKEDAFVYFLYITEKIFNDFKDIFEYISFEKLQNSVSSDDQLKKISIGRYVGN